MKYTYYKTAKKTARENNLVLADGLYYGNKEKRLFDFSLLDTTEISETEKELIREDAIRTVCGSNRVSYYGKILDNFTVCDGIAGYQETRIFLKDTGKCLYRIFTLVNLSHAHKERNSVYEREYNVTETKVGNKYYPMETCDVEI